jgi:cephalosporin hydroxylase
MKTKISKHLGFYFKWLMKSSLGPIFWRLSRAQLHALLDAHPDNTVESLTAVTEKYKGYGYYKRLHPFQVPWEYAQFIEFAKRIQPKVILEIGTADGGTLLAWSRIASEKIVSVDVPLNPMGWGYAPVRQRLYREFSRGRPHLEIHLIFGNSHTENTRKIVEDRLAGRKVDLLFIDGDHSYDGVRRDYELWKGLVRAGGYIVFHDILPHTISPDCKVDRLWNELKQKEKCTEIVADPKQGWAGIGVIQTS